uniref:Polymeric immunoglobulin receptor-like n=1 Tax=Pygocentrus nattereri TaxID=42514 RepID=A0AAR2JPH5_PYGNA
MKIIITFCLITGLVSSTNVISYSGGSVIMTMGDRHRWSSHTPKYICKFAGGACKTVIQSTAQNDTVFEGRFSLYESKQGHFGVLIRELNPQDAGKYRFGLANNWNREINLKVHHDACCGMSMTVVGHLNKDVSISCDYTVEHKRTWKYFYKLKGHSADWVIFTMPGKNHKENQFYITDDNRLNLFTMTIRELKEEDGGVYFCGTQTWEYPIKVFSTIKTVHLHVTDKVQSSVRVTGFLGGRIMMKCRHPLENPKARFLCRELEGECPEKTYTNVQNEWQQNGGFSLYDDTSGKSLMVFFRNLTEGTYRCGVDVSDFTEQYREVNVEVKEDPCCGKIISQAGYIGETLTISCEHPPTLRASLKHFCKEDENLICQDIRAAGKYSLSDHSQPGLFTVTISNLTLSDAGVYWCGVETSEGHISYTSLTTRVQISIITSKVIGHEGDAVEIRCPYDSKYKQNSKHVCKDECCTEHSDSLIAQRTTQNKTERFSVHDDITAGVFSVNISRVKAEDAGRYWCGVEAGDVLMNYLSTELQVVRKEVLQVFGRETLSVSIECSYRGESPESDGKFLCMGQQLASCDKGGVKVSSEKNRTGRFSLSNDAPAGVFTVTITDLREEDSGTYWCGEESLGSSIYTEVHLHVSNGPAPSVIITVCVCVALLLIGGATLIFFKLKHKRTQGSSSSNRTDITNSDRVSPAACDYEEVNHSGQYPDSDTSVYMNTSPSTNSSDKNKAVCIYSTVQLPKDEGPAYATVSFQKNPDSPSNLLVSTVAFIKEESATEYATVKHRPRLE